VITRFAPSPTGYLHLGHAYAALFAAELARRSGGKFLLRFEDIDITRVRDHYYDEIESDLRWLGLSWEAEVITQTERQSAYDVALERLKQLGLVYPCFCSRKQIQAELATITNAPHGPEGPLYPGTCLKLTADEIAQKLGEGLIPSWRFHSARATELLPPLTFTDSFKGEITVDPLLLGDTILARKDIGTSYHIAVVVDDAHQEITDITRGEDLFHATHLHRVLQYFLELPEPNYHHHQLITDADGKRLAKRDEATSIKSLREKGLTPKEVIAKLPPITFR